MMPITFCRSIVAPVAECFELLPSSIQEYCDKLRISANLAICEKHFFVKMTKTNVNLIDRFSITDQLLKFFFSILIIESSDVLHIRCSEASDNHTLHEFLCASGTNSH